MSRLTLDAREVAAFLGMPVSNPGVKHILYCAMPIAHVCCATLRALESAPPHIQDAIQRVGRAAKLASYNFLNGLFQHLDTWDGLFVRGDILAWLCCVAYTGTACDAFQVLPRIVLLGEGSRTPEPPMMALMAYGLACVKYANRLQNGAVIETDVEKQAFRALFRPWESCCPLRVPDADFDRKIPDMQSQTDALYGYFVSQLNVAPKPHHVSVTLHKCARLYHVISVNVRQPTEAYTRILRFPSRSGKRQRDDDTRMAVETHTEEILHVCHELAGLFAQEECKKRKA